MTILVDEAQWPWRDTYWAHLVSDSNLTELHEFAGRLGSRRVGFQGDHYDIDVETRLLALEFGAEPCDSRDLVRRMKAAGLRLRPSQFTKWSLVIRGEDGPPPPDHVPVHLAPYRTIAEGFFILERKRWDGTMSQATVLYGKSNQQLPNENPAAGIFARTDRDGTWSIEQIMPPPTPQE